MADKPKTLMGLPLVEVDDLVIVRQCDVKWADN